MPVQPPYLPQVVVKFRDHIRLPYVDDIGPEIERENLGPWADFVRTFAGVRTRRLFQSVNADRFRMFIERRVPIDAKLQERNLQGYFVFEVPDSIDPHEVARELSGWTTVETAYVDRMVRSPQIACDVSYEAAPTSATGGINVTAVAGVPGAAGDGQRVIDLEHAWNDQHVALAGLGGILPPLFGENAGTAHGTSVLGILFGQDATAPGLAGGFTGIVPNLLSAHVVSSKKTGAMFASLSTIPDAIVAAIDNLVMGNQFGNVLLIEEQTPDLWPVETDIACFDAISLATGLGVVVVEAAGNRSNTIGGATGSADLDQYSDPTRGLFLKRVPGNGQFQDSGAILVAAAHSASTIGAPTFAHDWLDGASTYGSRIDCYAWGENVYTCTSAYAADTHAYTCFSGTSSASAIVAGAALSVQGMAEASPYALRYSPLQLRQILSDPANGTPGAVKPIGVMPDLGKIAASALNVMPDLYMRDFVGDLGNSNAVVASSPDIILRNVRSATPQTDFGPGSGTENDYGISVDAVPGFDHYVYVRLLNRGGSTLANVDVTVYWSEPSTLITPAMWTRIGRTQVAMLPIGRQIAVSDALRWPAASIPAPGHYCFVAVADHQQDPGPPLPAPLTWDHFVAWVGNNNNVGWRNFNVVSVDLLTSLGDIALPFYVKGEPNHDFAMELQVVAHLPAGSTLGIELPISLLQDLGLFSRLLRRVDGTSNAILPINPNGMSRLLRMTYAAGWRLPTALRVFVPPAVRNNTYDIFARQMYDGTEVGRVTWRLKRTRQAPFAPTNLGII